MALIHRRSHPQTKTTHQRLAVAALALGVSACSLSPTGHDTGGVDTPPTTYGRGVVVVESDYQSTNVSLLDWEGAVSSSSLVSSSSASPGLSTPLSGDVVMPTERQPGNEIVLIDRFMTSVISWVSVSQGKVVRQLPVATGFASNPHDYLAVAEHKAYVTRFGDNPNPGKLPWDRGSDVLIIDPQTPSIAGSIDMTSAMAGEPSRYLPRPDRMLKIRDDVWVLLAGYTRDFSESASSRLVRIDTERDSIRQVLILDGMHGCSAMARSPSDSRFVVACSGEFGGDSKPDIRSSGLVLVDVDESGRGSERKRLSADSIARGRPLGLGVWYVDDDRVIVTGLGEQSADATVGDMVALVELSTGQSKTLIESHEPFVLGDVRCGTEPLSDGERQRVCFATDAEKGVVHAWVFSQEHPGGRARASVKVDQSIGLPPRVLGGW